MVRDAGLQPGEYLDVFANSILGKQTSSPPTTWTFGIGESAPSGWVFNWAGSCVPETCRDAVLLTFSLAAYDCIVHPEKGAGNPLAIQKCLIEDVFPATGRDPAQLGTVLKINGDGTGECIEVLQNALAAAWFWDNKIKQSKLAAWNAMIRFHEDGLIQVPWYRPAWRDIWGDVNYWMVFWWTVFAMFCFGVVAQLFFRTEVGKKRKKELDVIWKDCTTRCCGPDTCIGQISKIKIRVPRMREMRERARGDRM